MKELRQQSGQPESGFRLAVAVDGVNALWGRSTIKKEDKSPVSETHLQSCHASYSSPCFSFRFHWQEVLRVSLSSCHQVDPEELTLVYNLKKMMTNDWVRRTHWRRWPRLRENIILFSINIHSLCLRLEAPSSPLWLRRGLSTLQKMPTCLRSCWERSEIILFCFVSVTLVLELWQQISFFPSLF